MLPSPDVCLTTAQLKEIASEITADIVLEHDGSPEFAEIIRAIFDEMINNVERMLRAAGKAKYEGRDTFKKYVSRKH